MNKPMTKDLAHCKTWIENALKYSGGTHDFWDIPNAGQLAKDA